MAPYFTPLITVTALCAGWLVGSIARDRLPEHHVRDASKELVQTASAMIATLVALVIGLLVSSAKSTLDQANDGLTQSGTKMILLDRTLRRYGAEAMPIRIEIKDSIQSAIERLWPSGHEPKEGTAAVERKRGIDEVQKTIEQLTPTDESKRNLRTQALQICDDLGQSRWLMIERNQTALPTPFLVILILWLTVLFTLLGLLSPRNSTTVACSFVCAASMAGAIFLIMEMNRPFDGLIQASPGPLLKALAVIARE